MRHRIRAFSLVTLACFYASTSLAQETKPAGIIKRKFKHHAEIVSRYDPSSDKTMVVLNPYKIPLDVMRITVEPDFFSIMCGFTYKGQTLTGVPDTIEFHIFSDGTGGWKFDSDKKRVLSVTIDGQRIEVGTMSLVKSKHYAFSSSPANNGRDGFLEELYIPLTYEGMVKIASGRGVLLRIGQQKIKLEGEQMEALRDLASRMTP